MKYHLHSVKFHCRLKDHSSVGRAVEVLVLLWFCLKWPSCTKVGHQSCWVCGSHIYAKGKSNFLLFLVSPKALKVVIQLIHIFKY